MSSGTSDRIVRVLIADDEAMFRTSLRQLLTAPPSVIQDVYGIDVGAGFEVVGEASTGTEAWTLAAKLQPDVVVLDINKEERKLSLGHKQVEEDP